MLIPLRFKYIKNMTIIGENIYMEPVQETIKGILPKINPTKKDRDKIEKTLKQFTTLVQHEIDKTKTNPTIEIVGSIAKDTYLKNTLDIDVFLLFDPNVKRNIIAETTLKIGKKLLKNTEECYAEHPYIRGIFNDYKLELVPGYLIKDASQKISAVDRTPLHTKYIKSHISEIQKQEIRLFKQFLHGINCYGAEAEIQGFSGYLCEILIVKYKSFLQLIQNAKNWDSPIHLSLHQESPIDFSDPLVFIDPVDPERNVASAVSDKTLNRFMKACDAFLLKPKKTFFFPNPVKPWSLEKIKKYVTSTEKQYISIIFSKPDLISENLVPQLRKTCKFIKNEATQNDFIIYDIDFTIDEKHQFIYIIIQSDRKPLSETYTHIGPPTKLTEHIKKFEEKWKDHPLLHKEPYENEKRMYVSVKRKHRMLISFLADNLQSYPLSRHIERKIKKNYFIEKDEELVKKELQIFWTMYFDGKDPWER
ncbi:CCA tRNA nucleotidyltransferase [Thermoplasmatales archaeon ex4572_165]|nr:MAG: CCA tRNA nucleotidyltransferase [Thermoplasmatales archaeon ex4572_165]